MLHQIISEAKGESTFFHQVRVYPKSFNQLTFCTHGYIIQQSAACLCETSPYQINLIVIELYQIILSLFFIHTLFVAFVCSFSFFWD